MMNALLHAIFAVVVLGMFITIARLGIDELRFWLEYGDLYEEEDGERL